MACEIFDPKKFNVVCVTHSDGFAGINKQELKEENKKKIINMGGKILTATHTLSGVESGISKKLAGGVVFPVELFARLMRLIIGDGIKVCIEIALGAADAGLLELAFINLLDNAGKYSEGPAQITIKIDLEEEEVVVQIADRGKGIPSEDIEHIFERFYRVDKTHSRKLGGTGLGLSIVKTIITKHDGTIEVSSKLGKGTTFTITLPLRHHSRL